MSEKCISILGSTGSIGTQTLDVIKEHRSFFRVVGLAAGSNLELLRNQIQEFSPQVVSVKNIDGEEGNIKVATHPETDTVVIASPGLPGIIPTIEAIKAKKTIALATKEVLVSAGNVVTELARENNVNIVPIDSEHSAIFQCLGNHKIEEVEKIYLTCSGGPFRGMNYGELKNVTVAQALNHPNWKMGKKITVDSATLMNKGFEAIEACWLFGVPLEKIQVLVHPQSVIHSAVEFIDGSIIAQLGPSDMRLPIQYALFYPEERQKNPFRRFSFFEARTLTFEEPDLDNFSCLKLAYQAAELGGTYTSVLNGANDMAVDRFLNGDLPFYKIPEVIEDVLGKHVPIYNPSLDEILEADLWARRLSEKKCR